VIRGGASDWPAQNYWGGDLLAQCKQSRSRIDYWCPTAGRDFLGQGEVGDAEVHTKIAPGMWPSVRENGSYALNGPNILHFRAWVVSGGVFEGPEPAHWWKDDSTQEIPEVRLPAHLTNPVICR